MKYQTILMPLLSGLVYFGSVSCAEVSQDTPEQTQLTLTGSSTVAPLASEIAKRFEEENPGIRVDVQTGGSSRGFSDADQGLADIGMVSRGLDESEKAKFQDFTIARDGVGIIVHKNNPVESLTNEQVVDIYTGKINNWKDVGGTPNSMTVVNKAEGRSTLEVFLKYFALKNSQVKADTIIGDNQQGLKTVSGNENAIGYVSIGAAEYDINQGVPIKLLPVDGVPGTTQTVQDGTFPLSRPLNLVTKEPPSGLPLKYIEFAQSEAVHDLVQQQNLVPIATSESSEN